MGARQQEFGLMCMGNLLRRRQGVIIGAGGVVACTQRDHVKLKNRRIDERKDGGFFNPNRIGWQYEACGTTYAPIFPPLRPIRTA